MDEKRLPTRADNFFMPTSAPPQATRDTAARIRTFLGWE
jgi:hypothetical protein